MGSKMTVGLIESISIDTLRSAEPFKKLAIDGERSGEETLRNRERLIENLFEMLENILLEQRILLFEERLQIFVESCEKVDERLRRASIVLLMKCLKCLKYDRMARMGERQFIEYSNGTRGEL
jgi:hypothetical protein